MEHGKSVETQKNLHTLCSLRSSHDNSTRVAIKESQKANLPFGEGCPCSFVGRTALAASPRMSVGGQPKWHASIARSV
eukprot:959058-Amphidinium_carterae.1